jgi:uncharacterized protein
MEELAPHMPLAGAKGWCLTDDKAGMQVQVRGVAEALGLAVDWKPVRPRSLWRLMAPWGPVDPAEGFGDPAGRFSPPWPVIALATGRLSIPYIRLLKRHAGIATYTVVLQDPKTGPATADLIWVPEHDRRRGANVVTTLTSPHNFSPARIAELRQSIPPQIAALPSPRVAVILGGKNGTYRFTEADDDRFAAALQSIARLGASFLITPSRRTHKRLLAAALRATEGAPRFVWDETGDNPYPAFLAHADRFIVTADSVNMTGEPCATGRPVWVFQPSGGSAKFERFHDALRRYGATRLLPDTVTTLETWSYAPLDSATRIAREIERRWLARRRMLSGLIGPVDRHPA